MQTNQSHDNFFIKKNHRSLGFTLIELMVTLVILAILAGVSFPLLKLTLQRNKEAELAQNLMQIRLAIDAYKQASDQGRIKKGIDQTGYPPNLEILVLGVTDIKDPKKRIIKFLRRIPQDPMLSADDYRPFRHDWGLRSYRSEANKPQYEDDVYDVYSLSPHVGINGVPYAEW
jgi:general secretion pathway protein G